MGKWKEGWDGEMEREMEIERAMGWGNGKRDWMGKWKERGDGERRDGIMDVQEGAYRAYAYAPGVGLRMASD